MFRSILSWFAIVMVSAYSVQAANQESSIPAPPDASQYSAVLKRYCVTCHNEKLRTADLALENMDVQDVS